MDKFIITKEKPRSQGNLPFMMDVDTYNTLKQLSNQTHKSMISILRSMVKFCVTRIEIEVEEGKDYERFKGGV